MPQLHENWHRLYDSAIGRFISPDRTGLTPDGALPGKLYGEPGGLNQVYAADANAPFAYVDVAADRPVLSDGTLYGIENPLPSGNILDPSTAFDFYFRGYWRYRLKDSLAMQNIWYPRYELKTLEDHNRADAFRHCYASCSESQCSGVYGAMLLGDGREYWDIAEPFATLGILSSHDTEADRAMDLENNAWGRTVACLPDVRDHADCAQRCDDLARSGLLQIAP